MNERLNQRTKLGLTQAEAASKAGVSLATWRRWEENPESVSAKTRAASEAVLEGTALVLNADAESANAFEEAWGDSPYLTPRQAYAISATLSIWGDLFIGEWLKTREEPLHTIPPFDELDLRIMIQVGDNAAWATAVRRRCYVISDEIESGVLPFDRQGPFIDEVLIAASIDGAKTLLEDDPEQFDAITAREPREVSDDDDDLYLHGDDDWEYITEAFDNVCRWPEWEVPIYREHPLLPVLLAQRHPYTWFDTVPEVDPELAQELMDFLGDDDSE